MRYSKITLLVLMTCSAVSSVLAEEHRQHGAHEHGGGQLNVAIEHNQLMVDLSLPAMNVVGFEHAVNNQTEHDQVTQAAALLKDGAQLLAPTAAGACKLVNAQVESVLLDDGHELLEHDKAAKGDEHHAEEHDHLHEGDEHADFDVSYEFDCAQPAKLTQLTLSLFKHFPGTKHLRTQVITPTRQGGGEVNAQNNIVELN